MYYRLNNLVLSIILSIFLITSTSSNIQPISNLDNLQIELSENDSGLVKVLNYNTVEAGMNPEWMDIVVEQNPDIFLHVETGPLKNVINWKKELNQLLPDENPYDVVGFDAVSNTDGQAIYSRYPIISSEVIDEVILDDGTIHKMSHPYMQAIINVHNIEIMFLANHLSCCDNLPARLLEHEGLMNYFDTVDSNMPILYGGDFNSLSSEDTSVEYLAPMQDNLDTIPIDMMINSSHPLAPKEHIFIDTYRALNPDRKGFTLNHEGSYTSIDHYRDRIDYIFVNQHMTNYLINSSVVTNHPSVITASDHKPMYTWFNFKPEDNDLRPPLNPQNVVFEEVTNLYSEIKWQQNNETDLNQYSIYRNGSLIGNTEKSQNYFIDDINYQKNVIYIYQITATDISGNEGKFSLPILCNTSYGELFSPYNIQLNVTGENKQHKLSWKIEGQNNMELSFIKIYKSVYVDSTFIIDQIIDKPNNTGVFFLPYNPVANLKIWITVGNIIGETGIIGPAYPTYRNNPIIGEPISDRYDTHQYGNFLLNMYDNFVSITSSSNVSTSIVNTPTNTTSQTSVDTSISSSITNGNLSNTPLNITSSSQIDTNSLPFTSMYLIISMILVNNFFKNRIKNKKFNMKLI